jgi:hypothetical protein
MLGTFRKVVPIAVLPLVVAAGCSEVLLGGSEAYQLPTPDASLDPDALVLGEVIAACRGNPAHRASNERVLVDIFFSRMREQGPDDRPTAAHIRAVTMRGGTVLHRFNVPGVRARIDLARLPELVDLPSMPLVLSVPEPRRYDLRAIVSYTREIQGADSLRIHELGGRVVRDFPFIDALVVEIPDRSIPALRGDADVRRVRVDGMFCLTIGHTS